MNWTICARYTFRATAHPLGFVAYCFCAKHLPLSGKFRLLDDAFLQTIPEKASHSPLPQRYFDAGIRRYGFHVSPTSPWCTTLARSCLERAIFAHLAMERAALREGASIDTMSLTPTGGIPMSIAEVRQHPIRPVRRGLQARVRRLRLRRPTAVLRPTSGKNGTAIAGGPRSSYTTPPDTVADQRAKLRVQFSNSAGNATSNPPPT
jgi:hypothetical protein